MSEPENSSGALFGWRVLEIADGVAASFCGKILSDLGAQVLKVEHPDGDPLRQSGPRRTDAAREPPEGGSCTSTPVSRVCRFRAGRRIVNDSDN